MSLAYARIIAANESLKGNAVYIQRSDDNSGYYITQWFHAEWTEAGYINGKAINV